MQKFVERVSYKETLAWSKGKSFISCKTWEAIYKKKEDMILFCSVLWWLPLAIFVQGS